MSIKTTANALAAAAGLPTGQRNFAVTTLALVNASGVVLFDAVKLSSGDATALAALKSLVLPPGLIEQYAGTSAPAGWLLCNGAAVSRTTYSVLFAITGTTYGTGNGTTTFNVPDFRGRVAGGVDGGANRLTGATLGAALGSEVHTLSSDEMPAHTHTQPTHTHQIEYLLGGAATGIDASPVTGFGGAGSTGTTGASGDDVTGSTGGGSAHTSVQPTLCVNYIIKT